MPTATHAPNAAELPRAIAHIEQRLYTLHHEIRLVADLAAVGQHASPNQLSLETLAAALRGYADRIEALHDDVEDISTALAPMREAPATTATREGALNDAPINDIRRSVTC